MLFRLVARITSSKTPRITEISAYVNVGFLNSYVDSPIAQPIEAEDTRTSLTAGLPPKL